MAAVVEQAMEVRLVACAAEVQMEVMAEVVLMAGFEEGPREVVVKMAVAVAAAQMVASVAAEQRVAVPVAVPVVAVIKAEPEADSVDKGSRSSCQSHKIGTLYPHHLHCTHDHPRDQARAAHNVGRRSRALSSWHTQLHGLG